MMSLLRLVSCPTFPLEYVSYLIPLSFLFILLMSHVMIFKCADHVRIRLVQPLVALLTFTTYLGWSMLMVLMALLGSVLWDNLNIIGYPLPLSTGAVSSLYPSLSFFAFLYLCHFLDMS